MNLCKRCLKLLMDAAKQSGVGVVTYPEGLREAEKLALDMRQYEEAKVGVTWVARSQDEFERAKQLGIVEGYESWERYEAKVADVFRASPKPVLTVEIPPEAIISELKKHDLPNTPEGRSHLYVQLHQEAIANRAIGEAFHEFGWKPEVGVVYPALLDNSGGYSIEFFPTEEAMFRHLDEQLELNGCDAEVPMSIPVEAKLNDGNTISVNWGDGWQQMPSRPEV